MNDKKITSKMLLLMAKQSLKSSRLRNFFVTVTILLASALLTVILMFGIGRSEKTKEELSHIQQVGYYNLTASQMETLKNDDRIAFQIQVKTGMVSGMNGFDSIPYYVSELSDQIRIGELESGRLPEGINEIAVQASMLQRMNVEPAVGSSITLTFQDGNTETFTVSGIVKGSSTAKQFPVFFSKDYAESGSQLKDYPYEVYAKLNHAANRSAEECKEIMYRIGSEAGLERKYIGPTRQFLDSLSPDSGMILLSALVGGVILLACLLVIYGVFYLSVIGRIHQFGQLRTIGMTKKQMKTLVSHEGRLLLFRAVPIGLLIGGVSGYCILPDGFRIGNTLLIFALVFLIIYIITMISVLKPAKIASGVSPIEALRYVPQDGMAQASGKKLCRSLTPAGLGFLNFSKNRKKAVITMLSLALGGILFMTAATYISSFDKAGYARQGYFAQAEFSITFSDSAIEHDQYGMSGLQVQNPMNDQMVQAISSLDGVKSVTQIKNFGIQFDNPAFNEYGNDDIVMPLSEEETKEVGKYLESGSAEYDKLMSGDYVLAAGNDIAEEIYGWQFGAGDKILFHYFDGTKMAEKEVIILGILNKEYELDHKGLDGWFLMPEAAIVKLVSHNSLNSHLLVSTEPEKEAAIGEILAQMLESKPELAMETLAERQIAYEENASQMFGIISGLSIFIMMFSILSMMNTLITNIVTRKQELAMLESIGMSKGQLRKMLLGESLLLVAATVGVTLTIGTFCGYLLSEFLYKMGAFYMAFQFPVVFSLIYAGVLILVPLLIIFISLRSFSKEALVERLRGVEC